jgi:L,D-transpeptidase-like protein
MRELRKAFAAVVCVLAVGVACAACGSPRSADASHRVEHRDTSARGPITTTTTPPSSTGAPVASGSTTVPTTPVPTTATSSAQVPAAPAVTTTLATAIGTIADFSVPGGPASGSVGGTWHGSPSILPVLAERPGWVDVRLAPRPNGSTAWVMASDVSLTYTYWSIVIDTETTHLYLYWLGKLVASMPAGVGTTSDPTPKGTFFLAYFASPPSSGYGPFVLVTSAHSDSITDWESSGDAQIAIHGPLGDDQEIGSTGTHISHGCVRLHLSGLAQLRQVPAGSPVVVM